jgi:hypothetical protein
MYRDKEKQETSASTTSGVQENPVPLKKDKKVKIVNNDWSFGEL